jgi:hypothetical protein
MPKRVSKKEIPYLLEIQTPYVRNRAVALRTLDLRAIQVLKDLGFNPKHHRPKSTHLLSSGGVKAVGEIYLLSVRTEEYLQRKLAEAVGGRTYSASIRRVERGEE